MAYKKFVSAVAVSLGMLAAPPILAQSYLDEGLIACYLFDGNANDSSGHSNHGTVHGATLTEDRFGNANRAYRFDGNRDSIIVPNSPTLNPTASTVSVWVKMFSNTPATMDIISKDGEFYQRQYLITQNPRGFRAHAAVGDGRFSFYDGQTLPVATQWYHVAQTYDGNFLKLYVNGRYEPPSYSNFVGGGATNSPQPLRMGGGAPDGTPPFWFDGVIDDVRIYDRALSECEILSLHTGKDECDGVCVLGFKEVKTSFSGVPLYFNQKGWFDHGKALDFKKLTGKVTRFLSCYQNKKKGWCRKQVDENVFRTPPNAAVTSAHWYDVETCDDLEEAGVFPQDVKHLATGVELKATQSGGQVNLELTTFREPDTVGLFILRTEDIGNGRMLIHKVCEFQRAGSTNSGATYNCTDNTVGETYRAAKIEHDDDLIFYDEVKPKKAK